MKWRGVCGGLMGLLMTACVAPQTGGPSDVRPQGLPSGVGPAAMDRILTPGDIQVAEEHLRAFGFDPGPVDGVFTAETRAAVRAYQARFGIPVSGLLDRYTRRELLPGMDTDRGF